MSELVSRINRHSHDPAAGETAIEYGVVSGAPRTYGILSRVAAASNTVAVSAGIEAVVWNGERYVTARVTRDVTLSGDATSNAAEYLYLSTVGVSKSTTVPVFSATDGFWISGADRTLRWIGVMLPRKGTAGAYTYVSMTCTGRGANATLSSLFAYTRWGAMTADTQYSVSIAAFVVGNAVTEISLTQGDYGNSGSWNRRDTLVGGVTLSMSQGDGGNLMRTVTIPFSNTTTYVTLVKSNANSCSDALQSITHRW